VHHVIWGSYFGANQLLLAHGRRPWSQYDAMRHPRNLGYVPFARGMRKRLVSIPNPVASIPQPACGRTCRFQSITRSRLRGQGVDPVRKRRRHDEPQSIDRRSRSEQSRRTELRVGKGHARQLRFAIPDHGRARRAQIGPASVRTRQFFTGDSDRGGSLFAVDARCAVPLLTHGPPRRGPDLAGESRSCIIAARRSATPIAHWPRPATWPSRQGRRQRRGSSKPRP